MQAPAVSILILNWNGKDFLRKFLPSVIATKYDNFEVLVADNGSSDESVTVLRKEFPSVKIVELTENFGFAEGNNRGIKGIKNPYVVLLNSDVEVDAGWLQPLVDTMEKHPEAAAVQPKLLDYKKKNFFEYAGGAGGWMDALGYPFCRGRIFEISEEDKGQYETEAEIFWATGACMMLRKSVVDEIGLFESRFFAHQEEIDFCWRARNNGYKIFYSPKSLAWHVGGGTLKKENPRKTFLNVRNSLASMFMNFPASQLIWKFPVRLVLDGVWALKAALSGNFQTIPAILRAHFNFYGSFGYWVKEKNRRFQKAGRYVVSGPGYFSGSIVWAHFVKRVNYFSGLFSGRVL